jgi:serine/threonine protein kinase
VTPERWARIKGVFCAAREQPEQERAGWLNEACGDDNLLRAEVESLLAQDDESVPSPAGLLVRAAPALAVGQTLSHYRVEAKIGEGGMGAVYRAYDTQLRRQVALKVLAPGYVVNPRHKPDLMREARAASALSHPNIVAIYEVGSDGVDFIAIEFVEGKSLNTVIPSKGLPLARVLDYAIQIASGLTKAHAVGVIHRDLKPGNIILTSEGLVKLLDFGLARRVYEQGESTQTVDGGIVGTPAYMSAEQAEGKPLDARSDIFSFGVVLYEMLAGRPAFVGNSTASILAAVLREEPPPLGAKVPRELEKIVARCLRKDPAHRFQHMDDVKVELEELQAEAVAGRLSSALPREVQRPSQWRWVPGALLAILAAILIGTRLFSGPNIDASKPPVHAYRHRDAPASHRGRRRHRCTTTRMVPRLPEHRLFGRRATPPENRFLGIVAVDRQRGASFLLRRRHADFLLDLRRNGPRALVSVRRRRRAGTSIGRPGRLRAAFGRSCHVSGWEGARSGRATGDRKRRDVDMGIFTARRAAPTLSWFAWRPVLKPRLPALLARWIKALGPVDLG